MFLFVFAILLNVICPVVTLVSLLSLTSQFTSDKNPDAGLHASSLEFVAGGLSVSGGV